MCVLFTTVMASNVATPELTKLVGSLGNIVGIKAADVAEAVFTIGILCLLAAMYWSSDAIAILFSLTDYNQINSYLSIGHHILVSEWSKGLFSRRSYAQYFYYKTRN